MASAVATAGAWGLGCDRPGPGARQARLNKDRSSSTESSHSQEADHNKMIKRASNADDVLRRKRDHYSPKKDIQNIEECSALTETLDEAGNRIVTMTGTIGRGKRHSQPVEVKLALSEKELRRLSHVETQSGEPGPECLWGPRRGFHIFVMTVLYMPIAFISSLAMTFYLGTLTWYNMYLYFSEECSIWHKIFICPCLILFYPCLILIISILISVYATLIQLSWFYQSWIREIKDFDKGFFAWLCNLLRLSQCAPYQVVVLDEKIPDKIVDSERKGVQQTSV